MSSLKVKTGYRIVSITDKITVRSIEGIEKIIRKKYKEDSEETDG